MKILIYFLACFSFVWAQKHESFEKIKSLKHEFISQRLVLSKEESQQFWAIYEGFNEKIEALHKQKRKLFFQHPATDSQALKQLETLQEIEQNMLSARIEMTKELLTIIDAKRVVQLQQLEKIFFDQLFDRYKKLHSKP